MCDVSVPIGNAMSGNIIANLLPIVGNRHNCPDCVGDILSQNRLSYLYMYMFRKADVWLTNNAILKPAQDRYECLVSERCSACFGATAHVIVDACALNMSKTMI